MAFTTELKVIGCEDKCEKGQKESKVVIGNKIASRGAVIVEHLGAET